nr:immunoglobulin light chain junction region [Macaca mulatta]MOX42348.1 immunoglobulin light chain junction region [Macaca mulatta]MOX42386.1 immunoglobulin light chain junction region [Macaca mulatta]MOX42461.1 immunoglobulin light chain junction region [Macaca mulatta]MOX43698.1 immunoglobulin light chain junction region [Macaca mulatta]
ADYYCYSTRSGNHWVF